MDRKTFLKTTAVAGAIAALPKFSLAAVSGGGAIKVAILGCGGRGTDALTNMIAADQNIEIVAAGDIFAQQVEKSKAKVEAFIARNYANKIGTIWKVKPETTFIGLDAVDKIVATDADVVMLTTPPIFRPTQIEKALNAGKHVFAEKPIAIDAAGLRKVYSQLIPLADKKRLCVLCGTQMRYHSAIREGVERIRDGQIGDIVSGVFLRYEPNYLMHSSTGAGAPSLAPDDAEFQFRNWLGFRWISGDQYVEQFVHNIDLAIWALGELPTEVAGWGGRQLNMPWPKLGNRQSNTHAQFEFASGKTLTTACRQEPNATPCMPMKIIGTKGVLEMSFGKQKITGEKPWESEHAKKHAVVAEHEFLFSAMREGRHINTMKACADSCYVGIAGREAAYTDKRMKCAWVIEKSKQNWLPENIELGGKIPVEPVPNPENYKLI